jgi:MFS family permease
VQGRSAFAAGLLVAAPAVGIIVGSGLAGKLLPVVGPRRLVLVMTGTTLFALVLLTQITESTGGFYIDVALVIFGLGAGLGLPTLTDTVMAAVPERDAGVGSALPPDAARDLISAANDAYVDAITLGFAVSAAVLVGAVVVALTLLPRNVAPPRPRPGRMPDPSAPVGLSQPRGADGSRGDRPVVPQG